MMALQSGKVESQGKWRLESQGKWRVKGFPTRKSSKPYYFPPRAKPECKWELGSITLGTGNTEAEGLGIKNYQPEIDRFFVRSIRRYIKT